MQALRRLKNVILPAGYSKSYLMRLYLKSAICTARFRMRGVQCSVVSCEGHLPVLYSEGDVKIGKRFSMRGPLLGCELGAQPGASIEIGDRVFINQGATVVAFKHIEIGNDTLIGEFSAIYDSNHHGLDPDHPTRSAPIIIGNNVWLSRGVIVLPGSKIGDHTVVAANSVVKGDLPPCVLAAGNPAQVVRKLDIPEGYSRHETMFSLLPQGFSRARINLAVESSAAYALGHFRSRGWPETSYHCPHHGQRSLDLAGPRIFACHQAPASLAECQ